MWILLILINSVTFSGAMKLISTCPSTAIQCSTRDSSYWKCCSENEIAFPSVESCTNGTLIQSECFPSTAVVFGGPGRHLDPRNSLLLFNLTKLTHIYAVKLTFSHNGVAAQSVVRVQVKLQQRSNLTTFTDCTFAGDLNKFVTFYCGQLTGIYGDGVRILTTDAKVDFAVEEIRIYEHPGVGCGYPGEDEDGGSFQPRAEFYQIGSRVRYACKSGTILFPAGSDARTCSNKGQWNGDVPRCIPEKNVTNEEVEGDLEPFLNEFSCRSFQSGSLTLKPSSAIHQIFITSKGNFDQCHVDMKRVTEAFKSLNKTKLKMELTEEQDSVMTTVYRSTELLPIDQVRVTCPTTVELCGLRLTKKEVSKGQPFQCPSPDGVANGSFSFGEAGLLYTCQKGYQLISDLPDRPIQCHNGKWTSLPPVCKGIQCDYPEDINGSSWRLLNQSTIAGSLAEYRPLNSTKKIQRFVCTLDGHWAPLGEEIKTSSTNNSANSDAYIQAYWVLVPFVLLVVLAVQIFHYRHAIYRRFCCCFHKKPTTHQFEAAYTNNSFPSDVGSGEFHIPELLPYTDEPDYPAEHLYESISVHGSLDNLTTQFANVGPTSRCSEVL